MITGNENKFKEAQRLIPKLERKAVNLTEIQENDYIKIASHKLDEAAKHVKSNIIVDDASIELECLNGFPGPYAKDFFKKLGLKIPKITEKLGNSKAKMRCTIGLNHNGEKYFFQGEVEGTIMEPKKETGFDYDVIFCPKGYERPFAELPFEVKIKESHRTKALQKLVKFLKEKNEL
ncbi:Non-canonical purine NTP pyrophosphatase [uncultured archaeon]|nr:Non-canonical purine NTP pyrophosphatase [uncultured archaeon]